MTESRGGRGSELVWRVRIIAVSESLSGAASTDPHLGCSPPASDPRLNLLPQRVSKVETEMEFYALNRDSKFNLTDGISLGSSHNASVEPQCSFVAGLDSMVIYK